MALSGVGLSHELWGAVTAERLSSAKTTALRGVLPMLPFTGIERGNARLH